MAWYNNVINNVKNFGSFVKDHIPWADGDDDTPSLKPDSPISGYSGSDESNGIEKNDMYDFYYSDYNGMTDTDRRAVLGAQITGSLAGAALDSFGSGASAAATPAATSGTAAAGATPVATSAAGAGAAAAGAGAATFGSSAPSWLPAAIGTAATLGTGIATTKMGNDTAEKIAQETNAANAASVQQANETNYKIAQENLAYQRELFDYNKLLQERIFDREDNAYQRTVADMRKAGLSPLMMNGTNGAGEAIAQTALNNGYQAQASQYQGYQNKYYNIDPLDTLTRLYGLYNNVQSARETLRGQKLDNDLKEQALDFDVNKRKYDSERSAYEADRSYYDMLDTASDHYFNSFMGFHSGMSDEERKWRYYDLAFSDKNGDSAFRNIRSFTPPSSEKLLKDKGYNPTHYFNLPNRWFGRAFLGANLADDIFDKIVNIKSLIPRGPFDKLQGSHSNNGKSFDYDLDKRAKRGADRYYNVR